jgi:hypothetical protein
MDSYIRQGFPIEGDLRPFQTSHEFTIREPMEAYCSINTHNPELAEIPLACFAIVVRKLPAALDGLTCPPKQLPSGSTIALCVVEQTLMTPRCDWTTCRSWHDIFPSKPGLLCRKTTQASRSFLMRRESAADTRMVRRKARFRLRVFFVRMWRTKA